MSRRGGFRSGGSDEGFRLLPKSWAGKPLSSPSAAEDAVSDNDPATQAATGDAATSATAGQDAGFRVTPKRWGGTTAAASGSAAGATAAQSSRSSSGTTPASRQPAAAPPSDPPPPESGGGSSGFLLWGGLLVGGAGVIVVGAFVGYFLFTNLIIGLSLRDVRGTVHFPPEFKAVATVTNSLDIVMDGVIEAQVPFKQTLNLPLKGRYSADVEISSPVPVKFDVVYDGTIPVDTIADITARADFNFQDVKTMRELEFTAKLPMKMSLPVKLLAPVDTIIDFTYKGPLVMGLDQTIQADVDTTLITRLKVNQKMTAPVTADIPLTIYSPNPVKVIISEADIKFNLDTLRLEVADDTDQPERVESPWGPGWDDADAQAEAAN